MIKKYFLKGREFFNNPYYIEANKADQAEVNKKPLRFEVINFLINHFNRETTYLEIGVRNPAINFDLIKSDIKYSVDPGIEFKENPVDFKMTSDVFFDELREGKVLTKDLKFDVIFIDGLHLADQVDRDIRNALDFIKEDGFIVLHDCNPPTEWHARETHNYRLSPARSNWNGTTWKAFVKWRACPDIYSCCIDTDWGVGVISKTKKMGDPSEVKNRFYDFHVFNNTRKESLNLISMKHFMELIKAFE